MKPEQEEPVLFESEVAWKREWQGMPEFEQCKQREYAKIIVRFRNEEDLRAFAKAIGQRLNRNSQCTWFPELVINRSVTKKYVNES